MGLGFELRQSSGRIWSAPCGGVIWGRECTGLVAKPTNALLWNSTILVDSPVDRYWITIMINYARCSVSKGKECSICTYIYSHGGRRAWSTMSACRVSSLPASRQQFQYVYAWWLWASAFSPLAEELFDIIACYFPVEFKPVRNNFTYCKTKFSCQVKRG